MRQAFADARYGFAGCLVLIVVLLTGSAYLLLPRAFDIVLASQGCRGFRLAARPRSAAAAYESMRQAYRATATSPFYVSFQDATLDLVALCDSQTPDALHELCAARLALPNNFGTVRRVAVSNPAVALTDSSACFVSEIGLFFDSQTHACLVFELSRLMLVPGDDASAI